MKTKTNVKAGILGLDAAASGSAAVGVNVLNLVQVSAAASFSAAARAAV